MYAQDEAVELLPGCDLRCRGCDHRHLTAAASEAQKSEWLHRALAPWGERLAPLRAVREAERIGYRDRVRLAAAWSDEAGWQIGQRLRDKTVVPTFDCPVESPRVRATLAVLRHTLPPAAEFPLYYFVQTGAQVALVVKSARMPQSAWLDDALRARLAAAGVEGLWLHLFPSAGRRPFGKGGWHLLWGTPRSRDALGLLHGPAAFAQPLSSLYAASLDEAEQFLAPGAEDLVIDLYCGRGASMQRWRMRGAQAVGVEAGGEAVLCAQENAAGATVLRGLCAQRLPQIAAACRTHARPPLLYLNPPRTGLEAEVTQWIGEARPARIAYLSCSAGTLRRDLALLESAGYEVARLTPYDFFPRTRHVESLTLLQRSAGRAPALARSAGPGE